MIKVDYLEVPQGRFPDNTLSLHLTPLKTHATRSIPIRVDWYYENDAELFTIICIAKHYKDNEKVLYMPYCPHARMDRVQDKSDVFTLKYFCEVLNDLHFNKVHIEDPHSSVCQALIENLEVDMDNVIGNVYNAISDVGYREMVDPTHDNTVKVQDDLVMFYPDEGAMKRYSALINKPYAFGLKKRDWATGKILGLDIVGADLVKGKAILIVDDICSKGGTFYHSAKALKEAGAGNIYLYVTHCEKTVREGQIYQNYDLIKHIYTTSSIWDGPSDEEGITVVNSR